MIEAALQLQPNDSGEGIHRVLESAWLKTTTARSSVTKCAAVRNNVPCKPAIPAHFDFWTEKKTNRRASVNFGVGVDPHGNGPLIVTCR
jgi:hypothetical protein